MNIELIKSEGNELIFLVKGINSTLANTLRRLIIDHVPTMAVEDLEITTNNSALYDEMLAHRIGLVPLTTNLKDYNLQEECKCKGKGCGSCQLTVRMEAKGPGTVYSKDLKTRDSNVKPAYENMPIAKLLKGQEIELKGFAVLGKGIDHAKFVPGLVFYKGVKSEKKEDELSEEDFEFYIESWGQLKPKEMLLKALDIFDEKLDEFEKLVKKLE